VPYPTTSVTRSLSDWQNISNASERLLANGASNFGASSLDGDDYITSDGWNTSVFAGRGNDVIEVMATNNFVSGAAGYDYYVFDGAFLSYAPWDTTWATLIDYDDGNDRIVIRKGTDGINSFADLQSRLVQDGTNVRIDFATLPDIVIEDTCLAQLDSSDFLILGNVANIVAKSANAPIWLSNTTGVSSVSSGGLAGVTIQGSLNSDALDFTNVTLTGITRINGRAGNDVITGSAGNDTIAGSAGDDVLKGGVGNDTFQYTGTSEGFDAIDGGAGTDTIAALANGTVIGLTSIAGIEAITAGTFTGVTISGSAGNDALDLSAVTLTGITQIGGGAGDDTIATGAAADKLYGGDGNDVLSGGAGNDQMFGENGDDRLIGGAGNDIINGGAGNDTVDYSYLTAALTLNLATTAAQTVATGESDTITNVENATGGSGNDSIAGTATSNVLNGGAGNDTLFGGAGDDTLIGGTGSDIAVFSGAQATYSIVTSGGAVSIKDNAPSTDGNDGTDIVSGIEKVQFKGGTQVGITSPVILDLDGGGVQTLSAAQSQATYDLNGDGRRDDTSWIGSTEGFLFLDRDSNGTLSGANELSFVDDLPGAASDLAGLRAFDSNGDGRLSAGDAQFASFRIWRDTNSNGSVEKGEILGLAEACVKTINLTGTAVDAVKTFGDVAILNTGSYERTDGTTMGFVDAALTYFAATGKVPSRAVNRSVNTRFGGFEPEPVPESDSQASLDAAIAALSASGGNDPIAALLNLSDAEAFGAAQASGTTAPQGQHTQQLPAQLAVLDSGLELAPAIFPANLAEADTSRLLAQLRQDMAGFGGTSATDRMGWRPEFGSSHAGLAFV
jgi:Ca2+-binding RTX toxin-like protein